VDVKRCRGKAIRAWDRRGHNSRSEYDALRRPTGMFVLGTDSTNSDPRTTAAEVLFQKITYGEGQPWKPVYPSDSRALHLGTVGDFCPKWEPAFGATAESAGAWYLLGSYLAGISLAKLRKKTVARGY
jgi:hypothetical protein